MTCEEFFNVFWPDEIPGRLAIWHGETKLSSFHMTTQAAAKAALRLSNKKQNVFFGVGARRAGLPGYSRGGVRDVTALPALFADIDVQSPAHPNEKLPPDIGTAFQIAYDLNPRPTLIIHSGGGLHLYHVLAQPTMIDEEWSAERLTRLIRLYKDWLSRAFNPWYVDPGTFELSRVLRPVETVRYKDEPIIVTPMYADGEKTSLEKMLLTVGVPSAEANPALANVAAPDPNTIDSAIQSKIESLLSHGLAVQFTATWRRRRADHPEWSQSEYDMAFAAHLARFEWTGEDIAKALVIFRRKHNAKPKYPAYFATTASLALALVAGSPITIRNPEESGSLSVQGIGEALGLDIISISRTESTLWIGLATGESLRLPLDSLRSLEYLRDTVRFQSHGLYGVKPISDALWTAVAASIKKVATVI